MPQWVLTSDQEVRAVGQRCLQGVFLQPVRVLCHPDGADAELPQLVQDLADLLHVVSLELVQHDGESCRSASGTSARLSAALRASNTTRLAASFPASPGPVQMSTI